MDKGGIKRIWTISLILILLFNTFSPIFTIQAGRDYFEIEVQNQTISPSTNFQEPSEEIYTPIFDENIEWRTDSTPDSLPSDIPQIKKKDLEFSISNKTNQNENNHLFTIEVSITNYSDQTINSIIFTDELEKEFTYYGSENSNIEFNQTTTTINLLIPELLPNQKTSFSYILLLDEENKSQVNVHSAEIYYLGKKQIENVYLFNKNSNSKSILNENNTEIVVNEAIPDTSWVKVDQVSAYFSANSVVENSLISFNKKENPKGPEYQFDLNVWEAEDIQGIKLKKKDTTGEFSLPEQAVEFSQKRTQDFNAPVYLEISFDDIANLRSVSKGQTPYVATYNPELDIWIKVPILEINYETNSVFIKAMHFSTWGAGLGESLPQNGSQVLLFDQPYTNLFTGSSRYSIPISIPSGRNGLMPSINLSYSSATVDGVLGDVQAPWVGVGWNIDGIEIVRKILTDEDGYGYENSYSLTINGTMYELVQDENTPSRFYTDHASFMYIELHNIAYGNTPSEENTTGEWWEVITSDGTRYRLGYTEDSEQTTLMYGYACNPIETCNSPSGGYASSGYAGYGSDEIAMRWRVDQIVDTHRNFIKYTYQEFQPDASSTIPNFDRESYLATIQYTGHYATDGSVDLSPGYEIRFNLASRETIGDGIPNNFEVFDHYDQYLLDSIQTYCLECSGLENTPVFTYDLLYELASVPNEQGTLQLRGLEMTGGGYSENSINLPQTTSAQIQFEYENKNNRVPASGEDAWTYPRLSQIQNGYGGSLDYSYENDNRGTDSWLNYRVNKVLVYDGVQTTPSIVKTYTYATPLYVDYYNKKDLIGYKTVTSNTYSSNNTIAANLLTKSITTFGISGLDIGRVLTEEVVDPSNSSVYSKVVNYYNTDNTHAPFEGWNYRYLIRSENYLTDGSNLQLINATNYLRDSGYGNLLAQYEFSQNEIYRKTYYEYLINTDYETHIYNAVSRRVLVDENNVIYRDNRNQYDAGLLLGDLLLTQQVVNGTETIDKSFTYDLYGNVVESKVYKDYGTVEVSPTNANYQAQTITYDPLFITYPVQSTDAMGNAATIDYLFSTGLATQSTDVNGWTTSTEYDGLGRILSVTSPGLSQPGIKYTYPTITNGEVAAPDAVKMEILDTHPTTDIYRAVWGFYDGVGRTIQTQTYDADTNEYLISSTAFDLQGNVSQTSVVDSIENVAGQYVVPNWEALETTQTDYDFLGRTTTITSPAGIQTNYSYNGLSTTTIDAELNQQRQTVDLMGRLSSVEEFLEGEVYTTVQYNYDIANQLKYVIDEFGNTSELIYDLAGRKTKMFDPDMGIWEYAYDTLGNLVQQKDARGQILGFEYNDYNQLVVKVDQSATPEEILSFYEYSNISGQIGFRTLMSDQTGSTTWTYSNYGQTISEVRTINGITNTFITNSDWLGRVESIIYPNAETVVYQYDALGRADSMTSDAFGQTSLVDLTYNTLGQITLSTLGNGAIIQNTYNDVDHTYQLLNRQVQANSVDLLDFSYEYDQIGNILKIEDTILDESIEYTYDDLNRLTSAVDYTDSTINYSQSYAYDEIGNITEVRDWDTATNNVYQVTITPTLTPTNTVTPTATLQTYATATATPIPTATATLTPTMTPTATQVPDLTNGLVGSWSFNEGSGTVVNDSSSYANHGTLNNAAWTAGFSGTGLSFDGDSDYVVIPNSNSLRINTSFSMGGWVYPTGEDSLKYLITLGEGNTNYSIRETEDGYLQFYLPGISPNQLTGPKLPTNQWSHVVAVYDQENNQLKLYLNSVLIASKAITGSISSSTAALYFSKNSTSAWQGIMDEVRLYGRALTSQEVFQLFIEYSQPTPTPSPTIDLTNTPTETPIPTNTPTQSLTITPTPDVSSPWGTGVDGDLTIDVATTFNLNADVSNGRSCADGKAFSVIDLSSTWAQVSETIGSCLAENDEILLINLKGTEDKIQNTGVYEFLRVANIFNDEITFTEPKTKWYGESFHQDDEIGIGSGEQRVMLIRVPNYQNVTINGTLTANAWNGSLYGMILFKVAGILSGTGAINASTLGYRGGVGAHGTHPITCGGCAYDGEIVGNDGTGGEGTGDTSFGEGGRGGGEWCGPSYPYVNGPGAGGSYATKGGQHAASGTVRYGRAGNIYGDIDLTELYLGSGGGGAGASCSGNKVPDGGDGGGIILFAGNLINFSGTLSANGESNQAGGSGGSIKIIGNSIDLSSAIVNVNGGGSTYKGGYGRIALEYVTSNTLPTTIPPIYVSVYGAPPEPVPTPDPIDLDPVTDYGDGSDGDLSVNVGTTFNINSQTQDLNRICIDGGDAIAYQVLSMTYSEATLRRAVTGDCLQEGDEVMVINTKGLIDYHANVGNYEFVKVAYVYGNKIGFATPLTKFYGNANGFGNIGSASGQQKVMVIRVPNYHDVTVDGTLTGNGWDGREFGFLVFRADGTLSGSGLIHMVAKGYHGGAGANPDTGKYRGYPGETYFVNDGGSNRGGGGQGGVYNKPDQGKGGGGAYGTNGLKLARNYGVDGLGGIAYGDIYLDQVFMGSGAGGAGGGSTGGTGGGSLLIYANSINFLGTLNVSGSSGGSTNGAAGAVRIEGNTVTLGTVDIISGGTGGNGRYAVYYDDSFSGTTQPGYMENTTSGEGIIDYIFADGFETGDLTEWFASITDNGDLIVSPAFDYWGRYALQFTINDTNGLSVIDDTPNNESQVHTRFYINKDYLNMANLDEFELYRLLDTNSVPIAWISARDNTGTFEVKVSTRLDDSSTVSSNWYSVGDGWQAISLDWKASSGMSFADGGMSLYINNGLKQSLTFLDNDTLRVENSMICTEGLDAGTSGQLYIDDYEMRRLNLPEMIPDTTETFTYEEPEDLLFEDGFELGDTSLWSSTYVSNAAINVIQTKKYYGNYGIECLINQFNSELKLKKEFIDNQSSLNIGFYFTRAALSIGLGDNLQFFDLYDENGTRIGYVNIKNKKQVGRQLTFTTYKDDGTAVTTPYTLIDSNWHSIQLKWVAATSAGANNGYIQLYLDGVLKGGVYNIDNDTRAIKSVAVHTARTGGYVYGKYYLDNIEIWQEANPTFEPINIPEFWLSHKYSMSELQPHAVTQIQRETTPDVYVTDTYSYDANGNIVTANQFGTSYTYTYNAENRLASVNNVTTNEQWYFTYDGDGNRIMEDYRLAGVTQSYRYFFASGAYEVIDDVTVANDDQIKQYYYFANQLIAMDDGTNWNFFTTDHLSSTSVVMDATGNLLSANRYMPYGELRTVTSLTEISETDLGYTGQRNYSGFELMDYNARFYSPYLKHFLQPDSITPDISSQLLNRYIYVSWNPVMRIDLSGHIDGPTPITSMFFMACGLNVTDLMCSRLEYDGNPFSEWVTEIAVQLDVDQTSYFGTLQKNGINSKEQSAYSIVYNIMSKPDADLYLLGHSMGTDSIVLAIYIIQRQIEEGIIEYDFNHIKGIYLIDTPYYANVSGKLLDSTNGIKLIDNQQYLVDFISDGNFESIVESISELNLPIIQIDSNSGTDYRTDSRLGEIWYYYRNQGHISNPSNHLSITSNDKLITRLQNKILER